MPAITVGNLSLTATLTMMEGREQPAMIAQRATELKEYTGINMPKQESFIATLQVKNRVAVPKEYIDVLKIKQGEKVRVVISKV